MTDSFSNDQVFPENLPSAFELEYKNLQKKHLIQIRLGYIIMGLFLLLALLIVLAAQGMLFELKLLGSSLAAWIFLFIIFLLYSGMVYRRRSYAIRQRDVSYRSGVIVTRLTTIPFTRIQHCDVSRGMLDQLLDLSKVNIYTAGGSASDITIPGLHMDEAKKLKAFILQKTDSDEEE